MKPEHRDAVGVDDIRIDLAVRVVVRNHLTSSRETDRGSVKCPVILLQRLSVPAHSVEPLNAGHEAERRRPAAAARFDVIAAGKIELSVVEPPGDVYVHPADAVLVVGDAVRQLWDVARNGKTGGVGEIAAD